MFCAFKGQSSSTPSSSMPIRTLAITEGLTTNLRRRRRISLILLLKKLSLTLRGRKMIWLLKKQLKKNLPKSLSPDIDITPPEQPESSQIIPKPDRGKGKVTNDVKSPPKLVKASSEVRLDPDEP
ncbi:hypothetical protein Tco_0314799, partial [Tanacetum coccineum]